MIKKLSIVIISLLILALVLWINRVNLLVWGLPFVIDTARPVAENIEVNWPDGPSDDEKIVTNKPNIILILADDLGFNDISLYNGGAGDGTLMTPNIDRIGKEGVIFNKGYAASASCSPSRASTMTGRYSTRFGYEFTPYFKIAQTFAQWVNDIDDPVLKSEINKNASEEFVDLYSTGMSPEEITIAEVLKNEGYYNAHIGKWHLGVIEGTTPTDQGFDDSLQMLSGLYLPKNDPNVVNAKTNEAIDNMVWSASQFSISFNNSKPFEPGGYLTDYYTDEAIKVIEKNRNRPFFLYLGHFAPHNPLQSLKEDYDHFHHLQGDDQHKLRVYSGMLKSLDRGIGKILDKLENLGISDNTLVIFSSDNGGADYIHLSNINKPYRGWKLTHFEGGMHIPFMAKWPNKIEAGSVYDYPIHQNDILPTVAEAAGAQIPNDRIIDGKNLIPYINNEIKTPPHETLFWISGRLKTVMHNEWKLIKDEKINKNWLFNLSNDPTERNNLAEANPIKVSELELMLFNHMKEQSPPVFQSSLSIPVLIDKHGGQEYVEGDEYLYWDN